MWACMFFWLVCVYVSVVKLGSLKLSDPRKSGDAMTEKQLDAHGRFQISEADFRYVLVIEVNLNTNGTKHKRQILIARLLAECSHRGTHS